MYRILIAAILALFVLACEDNGPTISEEDYGDKWPLTVAEAEIHCEQVSDRPVLAMVWVEADGFAYPLNGTAISLLKDKRPELKVRALMSIWRDSPTFPGSRVNIGPLIDDGLEMCESG